MIITVIGLLFGDEGKGKVVSALTSKIKAKSIIRFSGGCQAAHRVVHKGKSHIFSQFGSGSAVSNNVKTYLTNQMVVNPFNLLYEKETHEKNGIKNLLDRLYIDPKCVVIHEYNKYLNRAKEIDREVKLTGRNSTVGLGIGETFEDIYNNNLVIYMSDLFDLDTLIYKMTEISKLKIREATYLCMSAWNYFSCVLDISIHEYCSQLYSAGQQLKHCIRSDFEDLLNKTIYNDNVILEGSQGILLDRNHGKEPFITKGNVDLSSAKKVLGNCFSNSHNVGVCRGYVTRHGLGPLPTEDEILTKALPDVANISNEWQRDFRVGYLDIPLLKYSLSRCDTIHSVAVTNLDRIKDLKFLYTDESRSYIWSKADKLKQVDSVPNLLIEYGIPVNLTSYSDDSTINFENNFKFSNI